MANTDAKFSGEIFRKNHPQILAQNRHLASIMPVRLAYDAAGYKAGQVLAQNSVSKEYAKYVDGAASGLGTAASILFEEHPVSDFESATGSVLAKGIMGGEVFEDKLTGLDAAAKTDLGARTIEDATGIKVLKF